MKNVQEASANVQTILLGKNYTWFQIKNNGNMVLNYTENTTSSLFMHIVTNSKGYLFYYGTPQNRQKKPLLSWSEGKQRVLDAKGTADGKAISEEGIKLWLTWEGWT